MRLGSRGLDTNYSGAFCFAGQNDEFVASASSDHRRLSIWAVPDAEKEDDECCIIEQPLLALEGHQFEIACMSYIRQNCTLASSDYSGLINIWTPHSN